jgi:RimJ/RimL family protein N-acetyltransferase
MDDQVVLAPVLEGDLATLEAMVNDPELTGPHEWFGWSDPHLYRHRWVENGLLSSLGGTLMVRRASLAGKTPDGADALGFVNWRHIPVTQISHCWEIGIILGPQARGHGVGTLAQRLLVRYLFAHSLVNRIQATTEISNLAEQRALEGAGFTREGVLRGCGFRDGQWRDGVLYSILRAEVDLTTAP